jgi:hypothetical protein
LIVREQDTRRDVVAGGGVGNGDGDASVVLRHLWTVELGVTGRSPAAEYRKPLPGYSERDVTHSGDELGGGDGYGPMDGTSMQSQNFPSLLRRRTVIWTVVFEMDKEGGCSV